MSGGGGEASEQAPGPVGRERYQLLQPNERSLRQQIASSLRQAIISGSLKPGDRLLEDEISHGMHTSRGPIREALRQLEQEGLVASFPYRGSYVAHVSAVEVREVLIPVRVALEGFGFANALGNLVDADIAELEHILHRMEHAARECDLMAFVETDVGFHGLVMSRSGQPQTTQIWFAIAPRMRAYFVTNLRNAMTSSDLLVTLAAEHRALLDGLMSRDHERVAALLDAHVRDLPGLTHAGLSSHPSDMPQHRPDQHAAFNAAPDVRR